MFNNLKKDYEKAKYIKGFKKITQIKDRKDKEFFDVDGCGLEIEFGVKYARASVSYIETGLQKLVDIVKGNGKFVIDNTIGNDLNLEIVLNPFHKEELKPIFYKLVQIFDFYENFEITESCGVHANFRADEGLKKAFFDDLANGGYDPQYFVHNKYKVDFLTIIHKKDGTVMDYDEYIEHQKNISAKYVAVNFLKKDLIEFRSLDLTWENIEYVIDMFERVKAEYDNKKK